MATFQTLTDITKQQRMLFLSESADGTFKPIAYATSSGVSLSADTIDVSNKSDGGWQTVVQGKKSAEISADGLTAHKDTMSGETELFNAFDEGETLYFRYVYVNITENADGLTTSVEEVVDSTHPGYKGACIVSSLELTSDNGDVCKYSTSLASQGCVSQITA